MEKIFNYSNRKTWSTIASILISANICFFLYRFFHWPEGYWSVVSVVAVATAKLDQTFSRMVARLIGTLFGAFYAYFVIIIFINHVIILGILILTGIFFTSVISLQKNALSYAGVIGSLTIITVCAAGISHYDFYEIAKDRTLQVCFGIIVSTIVSSIIYKTFVDEKRVIKELSFKVNEQFQLFKNLRIDNSIYEPTLKIIIATLITFLPWLYFRYPEGFWATISCFFIIEESFNQSKEKGANRFIAHVATALFGLIAVLLFGDNIWMTSIILSLGLGICGYILAMNKPYSGIGNTMGIALCIMLLTEPGVASTTEIIFSRFFNVIYGITVAVVLTSIPFTAISSCNRKNQ